MNNWKKFLALTTISLFGLFIFTQVVSAAVSAPVDVGPAPVSGNCTYDSIDTAIGCISYRSFTASTTFFFRWAIGIAGGITLLFVIYSGFLIITSSGDPKRLQSGQELLTSAIAGVLVIIFSVFLLRTLGIKILGIL